MATVFLAEDLKHHRSVAIKVLKPELAAALGPERFLRAYALAGDRAAGRRGVRGVSRRDRASSSCKRSDSLSAAAAAGRIEEAVSLAHRAVEERDPIVMLERIMCEW